MKTILHTIALIGVSGSIFCQETPDPERDFGPDARSANLRWRQAVEKASISYVNELRSALEKATRQGKLKEAVAIEAEIKRISAKFFQNTKVPIAEFLQGTSWISGYNNAVVTLKADGKGIRRFGGRESKITYQVLSDNSFLIRWPAAPPSKCILAPDRNSFQSGDAIWKIKS